MKTGVHIPANLRDAYAAGSEPESIRLLGDIVWRTLLIGATLIVIVFVLYGAVEFFSSKDTATTEPVHVEPTALLIQTTKFRAIVESAKLRADHYEAFKKSPPPSVSDPYRKIR